MPSDHQRRAVLILGMHRSGTSLLASLAQGLGVDLGPHEALLRPSHDAVSETNTKGFFELRDVVDIHDALLLDLGMQWDCVGALPRGWLETRPAVRAEADLMAVLARRFSRAPVWGIKDPRMCRFMPLWNRLLARLNVAPAFVIASRDPSSVAASLGRRDGLTRSHALELWHTYMLDALANVDRGSVVVVSYDRLVNDPLGEVERVNRTLGIAPEAEMDRVRERVAALVDPGMRHHVCEDEELLPAHIRKLHEALEAAGRAPTGGMPTVEAIGAAAQRELGLLAYVGEVERRCVNVATGPWCQVFYCDSAEEFREDNSERIPLRGSRGAKEFTSVIVCKSHAATVRIDPLNCPGVVGDVKVQVGRGQGGGYGQIRQDSFQIRGGIVLGDGRYMFIGQDGQLEIDGLHLDPGDVLVISFTYELLSEHEVVARLKLELDRIGAARDEAATRLADVETGFNGLSARVAGLEREAEGAEEREAQLRDELARDGRELSECRAQAAIMEDVRAALEAKVEDLEEAVTAVAPMQAAEEREAQLREELARVRRELGECGAKAALLEDMRAALEAKVENQRAGGAASAGEALGRLRIRVRSMPGDVVGEGHGLVTVNDVTPLISVVMPSYNHEQFIGNAVTSVLRQTYPRVELIVVDDGSTDRTSEVAEKALEGGTVERCELIRQENRGAHAAINRGLSVAHGDVLTILNSDDMYVDGRVETMWAAMRGGRAGFAFSSVRHVDASGRPLNERHPYKFGYDSAWRAKDAFPSLGFLLLLYNLSVSTGNFVMTRKLAEFVGEFRSFRIVHDWDYLLRVLMVTDPLLVADPLLDYRVHGSNTISVNGGIGQQEGVVVIRGYRERADVERFSNEAAPCASNWPGYYRWFVERYRLP